MGLLSPCLLVFVTLLQAQGVSFLSESKEREGLVVYTGQICLMFQVGEMKSFIFFNRRLMWLFSACGLADQRDKDRT